MKKLYRTKRNRVKQKLLSKSGMSLVEMLATVVLIGLMGITVTTGVMAINNSYRKIVRKANEQTILSTTLIEMKDRLRFATDVITAEGSSEVVKVCSSEGIWFDFVKNGENGILIRYYADKDKNPASEFYLVSPANGGISDVYSSFESLTYDGSVFTVKGLKVGNTELGNPYVISHMKRRMEEGNS